MPSVVALLQGVNIDLLKVGGGSLGHRGVGSNCRAGGDGIGRRWAGR